MITPGFKVVSAFLAGGVASMSSVYAPANGATNGIDLQVDPLLATEGNYVVANTQPTDWCVI